MKRLILAVALLLSTVADARTAFCEGFIAGFKAGACHGQQFCLPPLPPMCPMPEMGERTYMQGYDRGFLEGLAEAR